MSDDTSLIVAIALAVFAMLFGARHIDATEQHEGVIVAIAFESVVKLAAFLAVGVFVTFMLHDGFGDVVRPGRRRPGDCASAQLRGGAAGWVVLTLLSAVAIVCLPRQFQVTVVGNVDQNHIRTAIWLFPLYLLVINIFVLPIALAGLLAVFRRDDRRRCLRPGAADGGKRREALALAVFIGGLSAATAMVIVATITISIMASNDLVMPVLLRFGPRRQTSDLTRLLLGVRRAAMVLTLTLGYLYFRMVDASTRWSRSGWCRSRPPRSLPRLFGALYWRGGTRIGAIAGLSAGFPGLGLHAVRAVAAAGGVRPRRPVRPRSAAALCAVRPSRSRSHNPCLVLEHAGQYRMFRRGLARHPAQHDRKNPGDPLCGGAEPRERAGGRGRFRRRPEDGGALGPGRALRRAQGHRARWRTMPGAGTSIWMRRRSPMPRWCGSSNG